MTYTDEIDPKTGLRRKKRKPEYDWWGSEGTLEDLERTAPDLGFGSEGTIEDLLRAQQPPEIDQETALKSLYPDFDLDQFSLFLEEQPEKFYEDLTRKGRTPETEALLRSFGAREEDIDTLIGKTPAITPDEIAERGGKYLKLRQKWEKTGSPEIRRQLDELEAQMVTGRGIPGKSLARIEFEEREELRQNLENIVKEIWPQANLKTFQEFVTKSPEEFIEAMQTGGRTKAKEDLLKALNFTPEDINETLGVQKIWVSINGMRQQVNVLSSGKAYDMNNAWVGTYNPITQQFEQRKDEGIFKDMWDAFRLTGSEAFSQTKRWGVNFITDLIMPKLDKEVARKQGLSEEAIAQIDQNITAKRDKLRAVAAKTRTEFEEWQEKNPDLQPSPEMARLEDVSDESFVEAVKQGGLPYMGYIIAKTAPPTIAALVAGGTTGWLTKNPYVTFGVITALFTPMTTQEIEDDLLENGASEDLARQLAGPVGLFNASLESASDMIKLNAIAPGAVKLFRREISKQLGKSLLVELTKRGLTTVTKIEAGEIITELAQQAIQDAVVKTVNSNREILANWKRLIGETAVATGPFALLGAGANVANVRAEVQTKVQKAIEAAKKRAIEVGEDFASERGAIVPGAEPGREGVPTKPEVPGEPTAQSELATWQKVAADLNAEIPTLEGEVRTKAERQLRTVEARIRDLREIVAKESEEAKVPAVPEVTPAVALPKAEAGMPETGVQEIGQPKVPKPTVTPPGVAEVAMAEAPPVEPQRTPITEAKRIQSELESDIAIIKKKTAEIKTPLPEQGADIGFARLAMLDAQRLLRHSQNITNRIERGIEVSQDEINALNDELASVKDALQFQVKDVTKARQYLTQYVAKNVPISERGKLLSVISKIQGAQDIEAVVLKANEIAEQSQKRQLKSDIIKELKRARPRKVEGIVKGRFGGDMQTELDIMNRTLKMTRDEALAKIAANQQAYEDGKMSYDDMILDNSRLSFAGIEGMTATELQETLDYIKSIKEIGRATRLQEIEKWHEGIDTAKKDITRIVTGGKEVEPGVTKEVTGLRGLLKRIEGGQVALTDFLDILSGTDKSSKPYSSALNLFVDDRVLKSYNAEQDGLVATGDTVRDNFKRVFNITKDREANDILRRLGKEKVNLGVFKNTDGKSVKLELTKGQMIDAYNLMQANENLPTFTEGNKFTQEMQDAISTGLTAQEKAWADWQRSFLADYWTSINQVYEPLYGVKLGRNENYWPRNRDIERSDVPEHILVQEDYNHFAAVTNGSLKARTQNKIPFKFLDANTKLLNHVTQMEHFKAWANTIRDLRSVFMSRDIKNAIHQFYGREIGNKIDDYISILARGGIEKAKRVRILDTLRGNVAVSVLGIKPMIAIKQPTALLAYATEMPYADFVTGVTDFLKNPVANYKTLYEKSAGLRARYSAGQYERDIKVGVEGGSPRSISGKANWKENVLTLIQMGDKFGTVPGMWAKYKSELKAGATDAQAILEAEKLTNRTQNTSQLFTLTTIQHGGSWARLATMFQDQPNKYFRLINSNFRNMINGRQGTAKSIANIVLLWVVIPVLFQWMSDAFRWRPERQLRAAALGPVNMLLIFGQMAQSVVGWLSGEKYPYEPSPVLQIADDVRAAISKMEKLIRDESDPFKEVSMDDVIEMIENFVKAAGMATGVPTPYLVQLEKAARGQEGKRDWRELLFSRWALEEPKPDLKRQAEDEGLKLGLEKEVTGEEAADKKPEIYDTRDYFSKLKSIFSKTLPSDIMEKNDFDKRSVEFGKALIAEDESNSQPNKPLYKIVDDIEKDESTNYSVRQYYLDWQVRLKIDSLAKLKEYDATHPRAFLGNLTQSQLALLLQYESKSKQDRKKFLEEHPSLSINPRTEWLRTHPEENAKLAIWGQAKVLTQQAYDKAQSLIKELDIPDSAIAEYLPPKEVAKEYFAYNEAVDKYGANSPHARLIRANDKLTEFLKLEKIDESQKSLELKVKTYEKTKEYDSFSDKESLNYKDDVVKDADGKTVRDKAQEDFKKNNSTWLEDLDRIEAHSKGTKDKPTDDNIVEKWMEHGRLAREKKGYDAEEKVWYLDNPDVHQWALQNKLITDDGTKWNEKVLRITVKPENRKIQQRLEELKGDQKAIDALYATKEGKAYKDDQRRIDVYSKDGSDNFAEKHVQHGKIIDTYSANSAESKIFRLENPEYDKWAQSKFTLDWQEIKDNPNVLRLNVQWRNKDKAYEALKDDDPITQTELRERWLNLTENTEYRQSRRRREAYQLTGPGGEKFPEGEIESFVSYNELPQKGYRRERYLLENKDFAQAMKTVKGMTLPDPKKIPAVQYDDIYEQYQKQFDDYENVQGTATERRNKRKEMLDENPDFALAMVTRDAYGLLIGKEKYVPDYVKYYEILDANLPFDNYEDDWYLMEHPEFYQTMKRELNWQPRDFSKVPTRQVWKLFQQYSRLPKLTKNNREREVFRNQHRDLDKWLIISGKSSLTLPGGYRESLSPDFSSISSKLREIEQKIAALGGVK